MRLTSKTTAYVLLDINTDEKYILKYDKVFGDYPMYMCGRASNNRIRTKNDAVSRNHCAFVTSKRGLYVVDFGSANGVYINGVRTSSANKLKLRLNDIIGLGCQDVVPVPSRQSNSCTVFKLIQMESAIKSKVAEGFSLHSIPSVIQRQGSALT